LVALNKNKRKELKKLSKIHFPGFGPCVDVEKAADTARKLSEILTKHLQRTEDKGSSGEADTS